mgnify:FL=1
MSDRMNKEDKKKDTDFKRMDSPDQVNSDTESLFDKDEEMMFVDPIPVEELNEKVKDEKLENREDTKNTSSSSKKYKHDK